MNFYEQLFSRGRTTGEGMTHFERLFAAKFGGSPPPEVREYTGAVPVTITADGTPLLDYLITGNTTQSGTSTPDNPIIPEGCGNETANLLDVTLFHNGYHINSQGNIETFTGRIATTTPIDVSNYTSVTFSYTTTGDNDNFIYATFSGNTLVERVAGKTSGFSIDTTNCNKLYLCLYNLSSQVSTADIITAMLNSGSTPLPYEPFGVKIPILSASTTTPVYLGEVETTRKIKKIKASDITWIDGSTTGYNFYRGTLTIPKLAGGGISTLLSNKYRSVETRNNLSDGDIASYNITTIETIVIRDDRYSSAADWLSANGDTEIWYVLATETTGIVNEPLMRIGDYADTLSKEQAGVTIPTNNGSTTVDVDTTVKPSEVYIKYMG